MLSLLLTVAIKKKSIKPLQFEEIKNNVFLIKSYREFVNLQTPGNPVVLDAIR
ncbi:hypothetical protein O9992_16690 [Vibrio lentus]|nr:hypothetical protein [Vibrio lentus]